MLAKRLCSKLEGRHPAGALGERPEAAYEYHFKTGQRGRYRRHRMGYPAIGWEWKL